MFLVKFLSCEFTNDELQSWCFLFSQITTTDIRCLKKIFFFEAFNKSASLSIFNSKLQSSSFQRNMRSEIMENSVETSRGGVSV